VFKFVIDPKVFEALKLAFPTPPNSAKKALDKYINILEDTIDEVLTRGQDPYDFLFGLYTISLHKLANKSPQLTSSKIRLHEWLKHNNLELIKTVEKGYKAQGKNSKVKLTDLVEFVSSTKLLDPKEIFENQHPQFSTLTQQQIIDDYDAVELDIESIQNYIRSISPKSIEPKKRKDIISIYQASKIIALASYKNNIFYQKKKLSFFGRTYYEGTSVQNVNKNLREAMLGNAWEYDMRSSVVSWKMGFAQTYLDTYKLTCTIDSVFPLSHQYSIDKSILIDKVKTIVFINSPRDNATQIKLIKEAMTALNFGARLTDFSYVDSFGETKSPALKQIFKYEEELTPFLECQLIKDFLSEQKKLNKIIIDDAKQNQPSMLTLTELRTPKDRLRNQGLLAYLYQHAETEIMNIFRTYANQNDLTITANIHDAIILKKRLSANSKKTIEQTMIKSTKNPYWFLGEKKLNRFK
jgi:hypothetical protein